MENEKTIKSEKKTAGSCPPATDGYTNSCIAMEGKLELEHVDYKTFIECPGRCNRLRPQLTGWAKHETGATALAYLESIFEHLNGRQVRITVEWI